MSGIKFFLDTNIIAYSFDQDNARKRAIAGDLLEQALTGKGAISLQVVQEFLNIALRKFEVPLSPAQAQQYTDTVLTHLCAYFPDMGTFRRALNIYERWRYSWYDSLIITAALELGCETLYSEDLQHQQQIEGLVIVNPFASTTRNST